MLVTAVNFELSHVDVPSVSFELTRQARAADLGRFDEKDWAFQLNRERFADPSPDSIDQAAEGNPGLAQVVYHEARHAEQYFRIARVKAGMKWKANVIAESFGIPERVTKEAARHPLKGEGPEVQEAESWEASIYGGRAEESAKIEKRRARSRNGCSRRGPSRRSSSRTRRRPRRTRNGRPTPSTASRSSSTRRGRSTSSCPRKRMPGRSAAGWSPRSARRSTRAAWSRGGAARGDGRRPRARDRRLVRRQRRATRTGSRAPCSATPASSRATTCRAGRSSASRSRVLQPGPVGRPLPRRVEPGGLPRPARRVPAPDRGRGAAPAGVGLRALPARGRSTRSSAPATGRARSS